MTGFYKCVRNIVSAALMTLFYPVKIVGMENLPASGGAIICCNHISMLDPVALIVKIKRQIRFMAKHELYSVKIVGGFLRRMGAFPVKRGECDLASVREALRLLGEGELVGVFPQGHRYKRDDNHALLAGAAMIALRAGVPTVPAHVDGKWRVFRRTTIRIMPEVELADLREKISAPSISEASQRIERGIWG